METWLESLDSSESRDLQMTYQRLENSREKKKIRVNRKEIRCFRVGVQGLEDRLAAGICCNTGKKKASINPLSTQQGSTQQLQKT